MKSRAVSGTWAANWGSEVVVGVCLVVIVVAAGLSSVVPVVVLFALGVVPLLLVVGDLRVCLALPEWADLLPFGVVSSAVSSSDESPVTAAAACLAARLSCPVRPASGFCGRVFDEVEPLLEDELLEDELLDGELLDDDPDDPLDDDPDDPLDDELDELWLLEPPPELVPDEPDP
jgi:hypothetical protein